MKVKPKIELVRLHGDNWESWEFGPESEAPRLAVRDGVSAAKDKILAVPARHVVALPLWVDSTEAAAVEEALELELDVRGLLARKKSGDVVISGAIVAGGRTLVICAVFPGEMPEPPEGRSFNRFEASPFLVASAEDAIGLWREGKDLVALFTRGRNVVYWATMDWPGDTVTVRQWLQLTGLQLVSAGVLVAPPARLVFDSELKEACLENLIPGTTCQAAPLLPAVEGASFSWRPEKVRQREQRADASKKMKHGALALAAAYLAVVLIAGGYLGWLHARAGQLRGTMAELEQRTEAFQPVIREWQLVGPGAESDYFPLEILRRVVRHLPEKGIRLTVYDASAGRVKVEGEATSAMLVSQFFNAVTEDESLLALNWEMPTPALLPNNAAHFQLSGVIP